MMMFSPGSTEPTGVIGADDATLAPHQFRYADDMSLVSDYETDGDHAVEGDDGEDGSAIATPTSRAQSAIENLESANILRNEGVDIPALIFGKEFTIKRDKQNAGRDINSTQMTNMVARLVRRRLLNAEQIDAVKHTFQSETGVTLIDGFPGTGKTATAAAAAYEHCRAGEKVLFVCPTHKAVEIALSTFSKEWTSVESFLNNTQQTKVTHSDHKQGSSEEKRAVRALRFVGGRNVHEEQERHHGRQIGVVIQPGTANSSVQETLYHAQKIKAIQTWAKLEYHPMKEDALAYLELSHKHNEHESTQDLAAHDTILNNYFVMNEVDILFTTCASYCHELVHAHFKPSVAFIDDAGQATAASICIALNPHKESLKRIIMSGDRKDLSHHEQINRKTDDVELANQPLFSRLVCDSKGRYTHIKLVEQHRQHPDLSAYVNGVFYAGKIRHDAFARRTSSKQRTVKHFFAQMGPCRKNSDGIRVAIDVSGNGSFWVKYKETDLWCNPAESRVIVEIISKLLAYKPNVPNGVRHKYQAIESADVVIVTPHVGQRRRILDDLRAYGHDLSKVTVTTTRGISGGEANIVFVSLCVNDRAGAMENIRSVAKPNELRIQNSRARMFQVTLGNFAGWCAAITEDNDDGINAPHFSAFKGLVTHFYKKGDIVALSDVEATILAGKRGRPTDESAFYKQFSKLGTKKPKVPMMKGSESSSKTDQPVPPTAAAPPSNRALKKARQIAVHHRRQLFEMAGFDSLAMDEDVGMGIDEEQEK